MNINYRIYEINYRKYEINYRIYEINYRIYEINYTIYEFTFKSIKKVNSSLYFSETSLNLVRNIAITIVLN